MDKTSDQFKVSKIMAESKSFPSDYEILTKRDFINLINIPNSVSTSLSDISSITIPDKSEDLFSAKTLGSEVPNQIISDVISIDISTSSYQQDINEKYVHEHKELFVKTLYNLINEEDFEFGIENEADVYVQKCLQRSPDFTQTCINLFFIRYFDDDKALTGLLRIISHLNHNEISPTGSTIALASLSHDNPEVRACGIRVFDNWASPDSLLILKRVKCSEKWLQSYLDQVICDIEEINNVVISKKS